jgi:hypothetical protein
MILRGPLAMSGRKTLKMLDRKLDLKFNRKVSSVTEPETALEDEQSGLELAGIFGDDP